MLRKINAVRIENGLNALNGHYSNTLEKRTEVSERAEREVLQYSDFFIWNLFLVN